MKKLSHTDEIGKANMVDVGNKPQQARTARAIGHIRLQPETLKLVKENQLRKGDVLTVAEIAGIQAGKKTSELIPLCHPLLITKLDVHARITETGIECESFAKCTGQTGIEMEALTAVNVALLTVYDMCKAVDKTMIIENVRLLEKTKE
ncbi:MAG TPA: cyclic pyranopterin monophosphate synthase MoaC [Marinilabiliales bacterium]|jgi:cyclic pyranopterin phosphate synthase|nr:MAG: molybdenum cofactor biosynthesis protein C [Bacteroidetes bacterium GWA2_40_14]OFX57858.1 MAG: molybdenum cofactor biosynthesis protein C [Bacteroidetes bacterium GWC2_40_13]OFX73983.1 MAG: molybdenum cofactor biosynthesis protein C [Bacteroidetes bacterium GWD2_40_43]OFX93183.1 MAG: molybdenum cofactor biosynthesis protein C [Bacteroidetes bacterium GWE2_40_63]OFY21553.1 MAG: molybdenum cofactor biosynthesis protein C [Bacteroidetes bacterium GWF2_40_13]OFZ24206.1 MAG: molybdenum cofa